MGDIALKSKKMKVNLLESANKKEEYEDSTNSSSTNMAWELLSIKVLKNTDSATSL